MAKKLYEERNIQDIADAIREKTGETRIDDVLVDTYVYKTTNIDDFDSELTLGAAFGLEEVVVTAKNAVSLVVKYVLKAFSGVILKDFWINEKNYRSQSANGSIYEIPIEGNQVKLKCGNVYSGDSNGLYAEVYAYDSNGNRVGIASGTKEEVPNTFKVSEMGDAIRTIGGGLPEEAFKLTGNCQQRFIYDGWAWFINEFGTRVTTENITSMFQMYTQAKTITNIPYIHNINGTDLASAFSNCNYLSTCPKIRGNLKWTTSTKISSVLEQCHRLRDAEDLFEPDMLEGFSNIKVTSAYSTPNVNSVFSTCQSLRTVPTWWYKLRLNEESTVFPSQYYIIYSSTFNNCYSLDEVLNVPVWKCAGAATSNLFTSFVSNCNRLKNFTFETQADGTPIVANWKSQVVDLSAYTGWGTSASTFTAYNSGITSNKNVLSDTTYQALKNDPDWFTVQDKYSRYNHDSAVTTINSLPDTSAYLASAGGTNTIKFKGTAGSSTDGGAINTLTAEEIAVATAKGWTVTLA